MVVVANIYGNDVAMMALDQGDKIVMLAPKDGKMEKYVMDNHKLTLRIDNVEHEFESYVDDNQADIKAVFEMFDEENQNYFNELSSEIILIICNK